jgi:hypothetical protein
MRNSGRARLRSLVIGLLTVSGASAFGQSRIETGNYQQNASFLSRRFLTDAKNVGAMTDDLVRKAYESYKVRLLFPNGGLLNSDGTLDHAPASANIFLEHGNAYEHTKGTTLMPYLNAYSFQDAAHAANLRVNLEDRAVDDPSRRRPQCWSVHSPDSSTVFEMQVVNPFAPKQIRIYLRLVSDC